ncbi:murein hydrolase activator EnvC family protein [Desertibaculum subflavum]|uniref:murein hydrolase activator EnvC family protein n=1 Tax=Desertibaculum subflavum TaxID=2268458 RepID=UPI000E666DB3
MQEIQQEAREAQKRVQELNRSAATIASEQGRLRRAIRDAGRALQNQEAQVGAIEEHLAALAADEAAMADELKQRRAELERSLRGLVVVARLPEGFATLVGTSPVDTRRAALLLGGSAGRLETDATALRETLDRLVALQADARRQRERLAGATSALEERRQALRASLAERDAALAGAEAARKAERERLGKLAAEARDVKQLIERLAAEERRRTQEEARQQALEQARARAQMQAQVQAQVQALSEAGNQAAAGAEARETAISERQPTEMAALTPAPRIQVPSGEGGVILPVRGRVVSRFGDPGERGQVEKGLKIAATLGAAIYAPTDGKVIFAGPFRGYGQLLILAHGDGYHLLIAGFGRIDANVGQAVALGEPIGFMAEEADAEPLLYVELRRKGEPVNPQSWLAQAERKVDG